MQRAFGGVLGALEHVEPARVGPQLLAGGENLLAEFLDAPLVHEEFDARGIAVFLFAVLAEHAADRLGERQHFLDRRKLRERARLARHRAEPAADDDLEAALELAVDFADRGDVTDVVHLDDPTGVLRATAEGRLEFPAKLHRVRMAHEEPRERVRIGRDVKGFVVAHAGNRAGGHVADGVAAGLARSDAYRGETAHKCGRIFDVDEMKLEILARGDVGNPIRVFLGQLGHDLELLRIQPAERNLNPQHSGSIPNRAGALGGLVGEQRQLAALGAVVALAVVIALAIRAAAKAGLGKHFFLDLSLLAQLDLGFKLVDLLRELLRQFAFESIFPKFITGFHAGTSLKNEILPKLIANQIFSNHSGLLSHLTDKLLSRCDIRIQKHA